MQSSVSITLNNEVENLTLTGAVGLAGTGNALNNIIIGTVGNDTLNGDIGNDTIFGGTGADSLTGGAGNDQLFGGNDLDSVFGGAGDDVLQIVTAAELVAGETYDGGADNDFLYGGGLGVALDLSTSTVTGIENLASFSTGVTLTSAQLDGFSGYIGFVPTITLTTGGAIDLCDLDFDGITTLNLSAAGNTLQILSGTLGGYVGPLDGSFQGIVNGGAGNDSVVVSGAYSIGSITLNGFGGNDTLTGGIGNETIAGGSGSDSLTSGVGFSSDTFVFAFADGGTTDTITDFQFGFGGDAFQVTNAINGSIRYIGSNSFEVGSGGISCNTP